MKEYFVSFVIQAEKEITEEKVYENDIVTFRSIKNLNDIRELEELLHADWTGDEKEKVTILNYREV